MKTAPNVIYLPVRIYYNSISISLDLRHAPFLWIKDLTRPDHLFPLPLGLPFQGWDFFNLLPVIYVALTLLQQKMQPKPSDPQMQQQMKMMTFMLVFFGFLFYAYPAGFLLYFIAGAAISMLESRIIKRVLAREGLGPGGGSPALATAGAPSPLASAAMYPSRDPREQPRKKKKERL